jgi:hypothetical protein
MQPWAKRGVSAALVTGGMFAVGSGVASTADACPDRPTSPWGEWAVAPSDAIDDGTPTRSGPYLAGELFPERAAIPNRRAKHALRQSVTSFTGTLDPVRDLLPAVEDSMTQEMPVLTEQHWFPPTPPRSPEHLFDPAPHVDSAPRVSPAPHPHSAPVQLAGWVAEAAGAGQSVGTPAEGYQRSLSWTGPLGAALQRERDRVASQIPAPGNENPAPPVEDTIPHLVVPAADLAIADDQHDGIVALWEGALGRNVTAPMAEAVLSTEGVDLTSARLDEPRTTLHTVPESVVDAIIASAPLPHQTRQKEFVPLQVPGENQLQAHEVPTLTDFVLTGSDTQASAPDVRAPLTGLADLHAFDAGAVTAPGASRISNALEGAAPAPWGNDAATLPSIPAVETTLPVISKVPAFSEHPLLSTVAVIKADSLASTVPERNVVARNPVRPAPGRTRPPEVMALPVLDDSRIGQAADIRSLGGETMPMPVVRV